MSPLRLLLCLSLLLLPLSWAQAQTALPAGMTEAQYQALVDAISKSVVTQLKSQAPMASSSTMAKTDSAAKPTLADLDQEQDGQDPGVGERVFKRFKDFAATLPTVGEEQRRMTARLEQGGERSVGGLFSMVVLAALIALAVEQGVLRFLARFDSKLPQASSGSGLIARHFGVIAFDAIGLIVLALVGQGLAALWFPGLGPQSVVARAALQGVLMWRIYLFVVRIWLQPARPSVRIVGVDDADARRIYYAWFGLFLLIQVLRVKLRLLFAGGAPADLIAATVFLEAIIFLVFGLIWVGVTKDPVGRWLTDLVVAPAGVGRRLKIALAQGWWVAAVLVFAFVSFAQMIGAMFGRFHIAAAAGNIVAVIVGLVFLETLAHHATHRVAQPEEGEGKVKHGRYADLIANGFRLALRIGALVVVAMFVIVDMTQSMNAEQWRELGRSVLSAGVTLFIAFMLWETIKLVIDRQMAQEPAGGNGGKPVDEDGPKPATSSRLRTLLPLFRAAAGVAILVLTVLVVLTELGVNTAPLIAGASVFGLAISFGSQTLVKDIVSGVFYLADDAFRVGEYIDTGRLKGTVEGFTVRSVKLRHQNGQIHTVPFGQLGAVTNFSRDWITVKFNLRFEPDTDLELVRKTTKKIGQDMLADAELAPEILEPLKMQGVADIANGALILRFKFTAKPAKPSLIQRTAVKKMLQVYAEKGIKLASGATQLALTGSLPGVPGGDAPSAAPASAPAPNPA